MAVLKADHDATREFVSKPIGKSADNMYSYLALVQDDPTGAGGQHGAESLRRTLYSGRPDLAKLPVPRAV